MLRYVSKFLLDIAPPVAATVVGAWIVTHYVNPRNDAAQPKSEAAAPKAPLNGASGLSLRGVEPVAVKPAIDAEVKKAARDKVPPAVVKQAVAAPRVEEKREPARDTADLVRAALERQRSQAAPEPAAQAVIQPVAVPVAPAPAVVPAPAVAALPPPVIIAPPRDAAVQSSPPLFGENGRPTPPAEIPVRSADASTGAITAEDRSLIGGIASAAKSLVDVVIAR